MSQRLHNSVYLYMLICLILIVCVGLHFFNGHSQIDADLGVKLLTPGVERYNLSAPVVEDFPCRKLNLVPSTWICLYPIEVDKLISGAIYRNGIFEREEVELIKTLFVDDAELGLIDIGANIGTYSLAIAAMGHRVVAVEPNLETAHIIHKSIQMGGLEDTVTLIRNSISNRRGITTYMTSQEDNQGATAMTHVNGNTTSDHSARSILMDDLVPFIPFTRAVVKLDIEGFEHLAMSHSDELFTKIDIRFMLMEWFKLKVVVTDNKRSVDDPVRQMVVNMLDRMYDRGYTAHVCDPDFKIHILGKGEWSTWPTNICWMKN